MADFDTLVRESPAQAARSQAEIRAAAGRISCVVRMRLNATGSNRRGMISRPASRRKSTPQATTPG